MICHLLHHRLKTSGYTLVEMLVALTASLILFGTVMTIFGVLGEAVAKSRHVGALDGQLCSISTQLLEDLKGATACRNSIGLITNPDSGSATGYFEIVEGPSSDAIAVLGGDLIDKSAPAKPAWLSDDRTVGDVDDMLFFTTQSVGPERLLGKFGSGTLMAREAEIAYFCRPTPDTTNPQLYTLHRRQLLIAPNASEPFFNQFGGFQNWESFYDNYDVSARRVVSNAAMAVALNTVSDLQIRRNRIGHDPGDVAADTRALLPVDPTNTALALSGSREGEDVIARNVLAFDVRVLDSLAQERTGPGLPRFHPGDPGYWTAALTVPATSPIFCDLGYSSFGPLYLEMNGSNSAPLTSRFSDYGPLNTLAAGDPKLARTYDTWTTFYQGIDPPYSSYLPAIQISIRLYDAQSKTIRQRTIVHSFAQ